MSRDVNGMYVHICTQVSYSTDSEHMYLCLRRCASILITSINVHLSANSLNRSMVHDSLSMY